MLRFEEYRKYDALGLATLVRKGETTPEELLETAIARIEAANPAINAVIHKLYDEARAAAGQVNKNAPFAGVPFLIKDLGMAVKGTPLRAGSKGYADFIPEEDSLAVQRMRQAGLLLMGKTNTPELGLTPFTEPQLFGPTRNPWNTDFSTSGSSGGSAAAVAAGMVPIATANDGGGSIRMPASACGLFGLKPSRGRVSLARYYGEMWSGAAVEGCVSRTVRDTAAYLDVISGPGPGDPYLLPRPVQPYLEAIQTPPGKLRIGYTLQHTLPGFTVDPVCVEAVNQMVTLLRSEGHTVEEVVLPYRKEDLKEAFLVVVAAETAADLKMMGQYLGRKVRPGDVEPNTYALGLLGSTFKAPDFAYAKRMWHLISLRIADFHKDYDMLLTPTLAQRPIRTGALQNSASEARLVKLVNSLGIGMAIQSSVDQLVDKIYSYMPWTVFANITGQPSMSVPGYWSPIENLPIGVMFSGRLGEEDLMLQLAAQIERVSGWDARKAEI